MSFAPRAPVAGDDDKYAKFAMVKKAAPADLEGGKTATQSALSYRGLGAADLSGLFRNAFVGYILFLMAVSVVYHLLGGHFREMDLFGMLAYASRIAEALGLLMLRRKVQLQQGVGGISRRTMQMYAMVYALRALVMGWPEFSLLVLDDWAVKALDIVEWLMVLDVLYSVRVTYRGTYDEESDPLKFRYLAPGCILLALVVRPDLREHSFLKEFSWTATFYLDVLALMPQVVMMARGGGKVEAPISHFVAATALSRTVDLAFWYYAFDTVGPEDSSEAYANWSAWLIIFFHVANLVLVADFLYYYVKARFFQGAGFSEDLSIPTDANDMI